MSTTRITNLDDLGKYQDIIFQHSLSAAATGGTIGAILPGVDTVGVSAIWIGMIVRIADAAGNVADDAVVQKFIVNLLQGAGSYIIGSVVLRLILMSTGIGILGTAVMNAILNFLYTARLGIFIAEQYDNPGFSMEHAMSALDSAAKIIFAIPTPEELKFAFKMTQR
ncbi:MAG: hypothetical protein ACFE0I_19050 [Elainellaceae cyanobacterium]